MAGARQSAGPDHCRPFFSPEKREKLTAGSAKGIRGSNRKMDWDTFVGGHVARTGTHADVDVQAESNQDVKQAAATGSVQLLATRRD